MPDIQKHIREQTPREGLAWALQMSHKPRNQEYSVMDPPDQIPIKTPLLEIFPFWSSLG